MVLRVPNLYKLELGLPTKVSKQGTKGFFDGKSRKLFIYVPVYKEDVSKKESKQSIEIVDTKKLEDDLLFDVV